MVEFVGTRFIASEKRNDVVDTMNGRNKLRPYETNCYQCE